MPARRCHRRAMSLSSTLDRLFIGLCHLLRHPREGVRKLTDLPEVARGANVGREWNPAAVSVSRRSPSDSAVDVPDDSLRAYFDAVTEGPGVWKWLHYFEIYQRHLAKFVGRPVTIVEVGVFSGGSLLMCATILARMPGFMASTSGTNAKCTRTPARRFISETRLIEPSGKPFGSLYLPLTW